jgi:2-amino-4-hydroxy-6-hydroxymethyldihydropteridine diphosphokinase
MVPVYIALGSNVGDKLAHLQQAIDKLKPDLNICAASWVYETAPMYVEEQPPFFNAAIRAATELPPLDLLKLLKRTEREVGRLDGPRYGPREVDLDLIAYGALCFRHVADGTTILHLPHPKTAERRFVLQPLFNLDPNLCLPCLGKVSELLDLTKDQAKDIHRREDAVLSVSPINPRWESRPNYREPTSN